MYHLIILATLIVVGTGQPAQQKPWWGHAYGHAMLKVRDCMQEPHLSEFEAWFAAVNDTHWHTQLMAHALNELAMQMHRPATYCYATRHALHNVRSWLSYQLSQAQHADEQWGGKAALAHMTALRHSVHEQCRRSGGDALQVTVVGRCMALARDQASQRLAAHRIG